MARPNSNLSTRPKRTNPVLSFYQRQKRSCINENEETEKLGTIERKARRAYKRAFLRRGRRKSIVEEYGDEEATNVDTDMDSGGMEMIMSQSSRRDSNTSGSLIGTSRSSSVVSTAMTQQRASSAMRRRNSQSKASRSSSAVQRRPKSAAPSGFSRSRRHSVVLPSTKLSEHQDLDSARTNQTADEENTDILNEWNSLGRDSPRVESAQTFLHRMRYEGSQNLADNNDKLFENVTKRRPQTVSHSRRFTEPFAVTPNSPPKQRPQTARLTSATDRRLSVRYPGGAPPSVHDRARLNMSRWQRRPKSAKPNYETRRITMLLYEKIVPAPEEFVLPPPTEQQKQDRREDEALQAELERRRIKRSSFQFLEQDNPRFSKDVHNLSEESFLQLKDFIKREEMRTEIFKYDQFVPPFSKTRLNMYRLGSHNDAYESYDQLDFVADKNLYQYMDRKAKRRSSSMVFGSARRKSLTKDFIKSLPLSLGQEG